MDPARVNSAAAAARASYDVIAGELNADRDRAVALWREGGLELAQAAESSRERYDWFYIRNPQGRAQLNLLLASDKTLVGSLGVGCREFVIGASPQRAGVLVDFVVAPRHRTAFPALMLQRAGRVRALQSMDLVYGLPGANAAGVCKRLETQVAFELPQLVRVVRYRPYVARLLPGLLAVPAAFALDTIDRIRARAQLLFNQNYGEWVTGFDETFDALWAAVEKRKLCIGARDRRFLQWRYGERPARRYEIFVVRRKRDRSLRMYFVCEQTDTRIGIHDCLGIGSEGELARGLVMLSVAARKLGAGSVDISINGGKPWNRALRRAGFKVRSGRPFFAVMGESLSVRAAGHEWYITRADEDT